MAKLLFSQRRDRIWKEKVFNNVLTFLILMLFIPAVLE